MIAGRTCPMRAAVDGLRRDATYCTPACRVEASRRRRLESGPVDGYSDLSHYLARQRRTELPGQSEPQAVEAGS
jgi:hypothetical protein